MDEDGVEKGIWDRNGDGGRDGALTCAHPSSSRVVVTFLGPPWASTKTPPKMRPGIWSTVYSFMKVHVCIPAAQPPSLHPQDFDLTSQHAAASGMAVGTHLPDAELAKELAALPCERFV